MAEKTMIRWEDVKVESSQAHNLRAKELNYTKKDLEHLNESWMENSTKKISDRIAELEKLVKKKTGRKIQKKADRIKEGVILIKEETSMQDLQKLADTFKEKYAVNVVEIHIHRDEGHEVTEDKIADNPERYEGYEVGDWFPNFHAHFVAEFIDRETGLSCKRVSGKNYFYGDMQSDCAEILQMERGVASSVKHLSAVQYKVQQEERRLKRIKELATKEESEAELQKWNNEWEQKQREAELEKLENKKVEKERSINDLETKIKELEQKIKLLEAEISATRARKLKEVELTALEIKAAKTAKLNEIKLFPEEVQQRKNELKENIKLTEAEISATKAKKLKEVEPTIWEVKAAKTAKLNEIELSPEEVQQRKNELKENIKLTEAEIAKLKAFEDKRNAELMKIANLQLTREDEEKEVAKLQQMKNKLEQALSFLEQEAQEMSRSLDNNEITYKAVEIIVDTDEFACTRKAVKISLDNGIEDKFFIAELADEIKRVEINRRESKEITLDRDVKVFGERRNANIKVKYDRGDIWANIRGYWETLKDALMALGKKVMKRIENPRQRYVAEIVSEKKSINLQQNTKKGRGI